MAGDKSCGEKPNMTVKPSRPVTKIPQRLEVIKRIKQDLNWNVISKQDLKDIIGEDLNRMDFSQSIKGLKAIQREAKKANAALKELEEQKKEKYLVIELDELGDVPRVVHQGKEITMKEFINFQWTTKSNVPGNTDIIVDYFEQDGKKKSVREGISS